MTCGPVLRVNSICLYIHCWDCAARNNGLGLDQSLRVFAGAVCGRASWGPFVFTVKHARVIKSDKLVESAEDMGHPDGTVSRDHSRDTGCSSHGVYSQVALDGCRARLPTTRVTQVSTCKVP